VFAGQYQSGQLLGCWACVDAEAATSAVDAAAAVEGSAAACDAWGQVLALFGSSSEAGGATAAAASYDLVMQHDVPEYCQASSSGSSTVEQAV
jgi:hypothetical protein